MPPIINKNGALYMIEWPYILPGPAPSFEILYHLQLFLLNGTSKIYKSSGTSCPFLPMPPKIAK